MVSRKDVKELFDLAEVEERNEKLRGNALRNEEIEAEEKRKNSFIRRRFDV